jgi:cellulose synthase (UDP-forming)
MAYIGLWNTLVDVWHGLTDWMYVEIKPKAAVTAPISEPELDWRAVLYHGNNDQTIPLSARNQLAAAPVATKERKAVPHE